MICIAMSFCLFLVFVMVFFTMSTVYFRLMRLNFFFVSLALFTKLGATSAIKIYFLSFLMSFVSMQHDLYIYSRHYLDWSSDRVEISVLERHKSITKAKRRQIYHVHLIVLHFKVLVSSWIHFQIF